MRNFWFPKGQAEYMTRNRFKELGLTDAAVGVRDRTFGSKLVVDEEKKEARKKAIVEEPVVQKKKETLTLPVSTTYLPCALNFFQAKAAREGSKEPKLTWVFPTKTARRDAISPDDHPPTNPDHRPETDRSPYTLRRYHRSTRTPAARRTTVAFARRQRIRITSRRRVAGKTGGGAGASAWPRGHLRLRLCGRHPARYQGGLGGGQPERPDGPGGREHQDPGSGRGRGPHQEARHL